MELSFIEQGKKELQEKVISIRNMHLILLMLMLTCVSIQTEMSISQLDIKSGVQVRIPMKDMNLKFLMYDQAHDMYNHECK